MSIERGYLRSLNPLLPHGDPSDRWVESMLDRARKWILISPHLHVRLRDRMVRQWVRCKPGVPLVTHISVDLRCRDLGMDKHDLDGLLSKVAANLRMGTAASSSDLSR